MSNFPYNKDRYSDRGPVHGSPLTFEKAEGLAATVLDWHARLSTSDWSQSNDNHDVAIRLLAWGLIEMLSDPNAVKRLITTGKGVQESVKTVLKLAVIEHNDPSSLGVQFPEDVWRRLVEVMPQLEQVASRRAEKKGAA